MHGTIMNHQCKRRVKQEPRLLEALTSWGTCEWHRQDPWSSVFAPVVLSPKPLVVESDHLVNVQWFGMLRLLSSS